MSTEVETFVPWAPIPGAPARPNPRLSGLHFTQGDLVVQLLVGESDTPARMTFESVVAFRATDEGNKLELWAGHDQCLGGLHLVEHSTYLRETCAESCGVLEAEELVHYAIYTDNECVDVIARRPPNVVVGELRPGHCCDWMERQVAVEPWEQASPDRAVRFSTKYCEYGIAMGGSTMRIAHCPWCGSDLPASLREAALAEVEWSGLDPAVDARTADLRMEGWRKM